MHPKRDLPIPCEPVYCEACGEVFIKYGETTSTRAWNHWMAQVTSKHRKTCHVDVERKEEIQKGHQDFMKRFDTAMFDRDPDGFEIAASRTYDSTAFDASRPNVCKSLPYCDMPPGDELALIEIIDGLVEHIGYLLGIDDLTVRYLVDHTATYRISKLSSCLPMIVSYMIDRRIANPNMNVTYEWWLRRTQRSAALSHEELQSFIHRESQKKRRLTMTSPPEIAPQDGLDYASMIGMSVDAREDDEHSPYSSPSPVALAARLLWIQHSGRHNHLEDAFGAHHIPTLETWQEFIKARRESRSLPEITNEVIQHLETLYPGRHAVPDLDDCLATPDRFAQALETMDHPPAADAYTLDDIRTSVITAIEDLKVQRQAERADLQRAALATRRPLRD